MTIKFRNKYNTIGIKEEFKTKYKNKEDLTDQSQLAGASMKEMAKKFGIEAMMSMAQKTVLENEKIKDQLYGHDLSNMFKSKEELLNTKKRINQLFEKLPAGMRKQYFNDDVTEFLHAYTTNNEEKLSQLAKIGIISDSQLQSVKNYNLEIQNTKREAEIAKQFVTDLERVKGDIYENYKKTGIINIDVPTNNTQNNTSVS